MTRRILYILFVALMCLCVITGCTMNENLTEGAQEPEQEMGQAPMTEEEYILHDTGLPNYIPVLAEWQEIASDGGCFVTVDRTLLDEKITSETFAPVAVARVALVEGCDIVGARKDGQLLQLDIYAIEPEAKGQGVLKALQSLEFVDLAWENTYDYRAEHFSVEAKEIEEVSEYLRKHFNCRYRLSIDRAFEGRLFTPADIPFLCSGAVEWRSYDAFKQGEDITHQIFYVYIQESDEETMLRYQRVLSDLAFVQNCLPGYWINGFIGYPME